MMKVCVVSCASWVVMISAAAAQAPSAGSAEKCAALSTLQIPGLAVTMDKAQWHAAGPFTSPPGPMRPMQVDLPAYCQLEATIDRREGAGGATYGIGLALALPDDWNGRFLMQGGAGLNGTVIPPVGPVAAGERPALARGFAVVATDTGHKGAVFDASFMRDQQAALDFAFVAIGRVARFAKTAIAHYYGRPPDRSYYAGCSTGGREGMVMAQRYPTYFDGIVSGAPAMRTGYSNLALRWMAAEFNRISPKDGAGNPVRAQAFSDADRKTVVDGLLEACDARDGVKDGVVADPGGCAFDPATLQCRGAKANGCLSAEQVGAIKRAFAGPKDSHGHQVYPAFPYDTAIVTTGGSLPGILSPGAGPPGPPVLALDIDVDSEAQRVADDAQAILTDTWSWMNLSTFSGRGGKLIFYHGVSDPWFSALDTLGYYTRVQTANGGAEQVLTWSRLFLSPAMGHCGGGGAGAVDTFDLLSAVVDWVEKGTPPEAVPAVSLGIGRSRPLCPYPMHAHYKGRGDANDASSFECRMP